MDMIMKPPLLSVVTPTYNRAGLLSNCFQSLLNQSDKDFEWIIVDDGSTDNTREVVEGFVTTDFPIIYVQKENGGKHTALNASHPYIRGKYVLILDSDDTLTEDAVASVRKAWDKWRERESVGILTFLKGHSTKDPDCTVMDFDHPVDILRYRRNSFYGSDCCEVIRSELYLKYPFPVYEGERFVSECALWNRVGMTHQCVYINQVIYLFEYLEGGLTKSGRNLRIRNPRGGMYTSHLRMQKKNYLSQRVKYGLLYTCYSFFAEQSPAKTMGETAYKGLTALCMLPGYALYRYWKHKYM